LSNENLNLTDTEKQIVHNHYGTIPHHNPIFRISIERFYSFKMEVLFIKYSVLLVSLFMIVLDVKNIRTRISLQDDIISEVKYFIII